MSTKGKIVAVSLAIGVALLIGVVALGVMFTNDANEMAENFVLFEEKEFCIEYARDDVVGLVDSLEADRPGAAKGTFDLLAATSLNTSVEALKDDLNTFKSEVPEAIESGDWAEARATALRLDAAKADACP